MNQQIRFNKTSKTHIIKRIWKKYKDLEIEIARMWYLNTIIIRVLGMIKRMNIDLWIKKISGMFIIWDTKDCACYQCLYTQ